MRSGRSKWIARAARFAAALALAVPMVLPGPAQAADVDPIAVWGSEGSGDGQFSFPNGIATDAAGNVYVADTFNNKRIQKFSSSGAFLAKWGSEGSGDGQFGSPAGVTTDAAGNVYVTDTSNDRIQKFSSSGAFLAKWGSLGSGDGQFLGPRGITTDAAGNVYVADSGNDRIQKFSSSGAFISKWGSAGSGDGQFGSPASDDPLGVATDAAGDVYVADTGNYRIQKFSSSGAFISKWGSAGSGDGQFNFPEGVATDAAGDVYVADSGNDRIQKFSSSGAFLAKWGSLGSGDGQFSFPNGIATDAAGNVYVADSGNDRIQAFAPSPILGETVNVETVKGTVKTKCKGERSFTKLVGAKQIPVGCLVDTRRGTVRMTSSKGKSGGTQSGEFWDGRFRVKQKAAKKPATVLALNGSLGCKKKGRRSTAVAGEHRAAHEAGKKKKKKGKGRKLWGKGKGKFKTKGKKGSATVRGTKWLVADRCDNTTLFKVKQGTVKVRDKARGKTITLRKGKRYVAGRR